MSLPKRFRPKVTIIEENKDVDSIRINELVSSLQTYAMTLSVSLQTYESFFILWPFVAFLYNLPCLLSTKQSLHLDTLIVIIIYVELGNLEWIHPTCHLFIWL